MSTPQKRKAKGVPNIVHSATKAKFSVNDKIEANRKSEGNYISGKIVYVHVRKNGEVFYNIQYDDGRMESYCPEENVRGKSMRSFVQRRIIDSSSEDEDEQVNESKDARKQGRIRRQVLDSSSEEDSAASDIDDDRKTNTEDDTLSSPLDNLLCFKCKSGDREEALVLCDGPECDRGCHYDCEFMNQVPEGNYYCEICAQSNPEMMEQRSRQLAQYARNISNPRNSAANTSGVPVIQQTEIDVSNVVEDENENVDEHKDEENDTSEEDDDESTTGNRKNMLFCVICNKWKSKDSFSVRERSNQPRDGPESRFCLGHYSGGRNQEGYIEKIKRNVEKAKAEARREEDNRESSRNLQMFDHKLVGFGDHKNMTYKWTFDHEKRYCKWVMDKMAEKSEDERNRKNKFTTFGKWLEEMYAVQSKDEAYYSDEGFVVSDDDGNASDDDGDDKVHNVIHTNGEQSFIADFPDHKERILGFGKFHDETYEAMRKSDDDKHISYCNWVLERPPEPLSNNPLQRFRRYLILSAYNKKKQKPF